MSQLQNGNVYMTWTAYIWITGLIVGGFSWVIIVMYQQNLATANVASESVTDIAVLGTEIGNNKDSMEDLKGDVKDIKTDVKNLEKTTNEFINLIKNNQAVFFRNPNNP